MRLTPTERDRLLLFNAAELARARRGRGLRLNVPEAIALVADTVCEAARDGCGWPRRSRPGVPCSAWRGPAGRAGVSPRCRWRRSSTTVRGWLWSPIRSGARFARRARAGARFCRGEGARRSRSRSRPA